MGEKLGKTIHDLRKMNPKGFVDLTFRPGEPGPITVTSKTAIIVQRPKRKGDGDDDKFVSIERRIELFCPGKPNPIAFVKGSPTDTAVTLSYPATAADLNTVGDWVCRVTNLSKSTGTFDTDVIYFSDIEILDATFDHGLLNQLLYQVMGAIGLKLHLQTSSSEVDKRSYISWSPVVTDVFNEDDALFLTLKAILEPNGFYFEKDKCIFHLPDIDSPVGMLRLKDLNTYSDFRGLEVRVGKYDSSPGDNAFVIISTAFETEGREIERLEFGGGGINLQFLRITLIFSVIDGFPKVNCNTSIVTSPNTPFKLSEIVSKEIEAGIMGYLGQQNVRVLIQDGIHSFFKRLMRLGRSACIYRIKIDPYLVVSYYQDPAKPCAS